MRVLTTELCHLEATAAVVASSAATRTAIADTSASADGREQLAVMLQIARHEVDLLQSQLHIASQRTETLQATLEIRELELQRTHSQITEHMRQSGALLGSLANLHQNLLPARTTPVPELVGGAQAATPR